MPGVSIITGDESIMFADNASFDGTERDGKLTTNGQLWIGSTASPHVRKGSLTSTSSSISITSGAGTINLEAGAAVPTTFNTDSGDAVPSSNELTISGGNNISTSGSGSTITVNVADTTQYNIQVGNASGSLDDIAPSATSGVPLISQGAAANPAFGTAVVAGGGTGVTSTTAYAVLCGGTSSTGALQSIASVGTSGQVLTSNGAGSLPTFQTSAANGVKVTRYTSSDTWTKDADAKRVTVILWGGGSGGGSGRRGAAGSERYGGGAACMAGFTIYSADAVNFDATETVTIAAGGTGGAAQTVNDTDGVTGNDAGATSFGDIQTVPFFNRGQGGTAANGLGGASANIYTDFSFFQSHESAGDGSNGTGADGGDQPRVAFFGGTLAPGAGGGGGGVNAANTAANGGRGGNVAFSSTLLAGGTAGTASGGAGGNGNAGGTSVTTGGLISSGTGGGGGAGHAAGAGGAGGNGGIPGGGGGGGGASVNGSNSGAGGTGGRGEIWVYEYLG